MSIIVGFIGVPDRAVFEALKKFQKDHNLPANGSAKPGDETIKKLGKEAGKVQTGFYIWHSVNDDKVRGTHAEYDKTICRWSDAPDPGEDYNCRCWAENIEVTEDVAKSLNVVLDRLSDFDKSGYEVSARLLRNYISQKETDIYLDENDFDDSSTVNNAVKENRKRFEKEFLGKMDTEKSRLFYSEVSKLEDNEEVKVDDYWDDDNGKLVPFFKMDSDYVRSIGSGKLRSTGSFSAKRNGRKIIVNGNVNHAIDDVYDFNDNTIIDRALFGNERYLAEKSYAKPFNVHWEKDQHFKATLVLQDGAVKEGDFEWLDSNP